MGPRAGLDGCGKSRPSTTGIRSPDRPARSQSLYRIRCAGPPLIIKPQRNTTVFARVICALFFSILVPEKSGSVKYADFFCGGLDMGFILV